MTDAADNGAAAATRLNTPSIEGQRDIATTTKSGSKSDNTTDPHLEVSTSEGTVSDSSRPTAALATNQQPFAHNAALPSIEASIAAAPPPPPPAVSQTPGTQHKRAASLGLHVETNLDPPTQTSEAKATEKHTPTPIFVDSNNLHPSIASPTRPIAFGSSLRSSSSMASTLSTPGSALASPYLAAMADITPLPSPLVPGDSPGPWRKVRHGTPGSSRGGSLDETVMFRDNAQSLSILPASPTRKKKGYGNLIATAVEGSMANATAMQENARIGERKHSRNRSISDFVPEPLQNVRQRHVTIGEGDVATMSTQAFLMHREQNLAVQRGINATAAAADAAKTLPSPPPSTASMAESDDADDDRPPMDEDGVPIEYLEIHCGINNRKRRFRQLRFLGQGTFSKVVLATTERIPRRPPPDIEHNLDPHRLVAVKMVEHGPAGGADEERIEIGLKREVEMLKSISHPSLIHLKACEYQSSRALLVLTYCPGGDLFDLASQKRELLTSMLVQRMFAELVSAVRYLHENWIVHRDIKLENVLVNVTPEHLSSISNPIAHPTPLVTLTDLGLSRRMPKPPESPLLQTRCGSEDYAAPEILLGQPYDGRQTDAWALGVLLYALMEGRLPFDAPPGKPERSRNTHRIARCDWIWCRFGDEDGDWDPKRPGTAEFEGARLCVEALLKKVRMGRKPLEEVERMAWVQEGVQVPFGLKMRDEDLDDEV